MCLDPKDLNLAVKREHYKIPTSHDISTRFNGKQLFTIIDEKDGFWTSRVFYCALLILHSEDFRRSVCLKELNLVLKYSKERTVSYLVTSKESIIFDDIIIAAEVNEDDDRILRKVLQRARENNVRFDKDKIQYKVSEVKYVGYIVSSEGLKPDPEKIRAVNEMPTPQNKQGLQRLIGMVSYLSQFIPLMTTLNASLRMLMVEDAV